MFKGLSTPIKEQGALKSSWRECHGSTHATICKTDGQGHVLCDSGSSRWRSVNLERWDGVSGGREVQERGATATPEAHSHSRTAEAHTIL